MQYPWITKANNVFKMVLIAQLIIGFVIAYFTNTWLEAAVIGTLIIAVPLFLMTTSPQASLTRHTVAIAVQLMAALHIQQAYGLTEMHFEIFVIIAFLGFYRDWKVILTSVLVVAVHHIAFFITQTMGMETYIFEEGHLMFSMLVIHAIFAISEGGLMMYVAKDSHKEATASLKLASGVDEILAKDGSFNLVIELDRENENLESFNRLVTSIREFVAKTIEVNSSVDNTSSEVGVLTGNMSKVTDNSVEQIHMIATATEQMTIVNKDVAERASDVNTLTVKATEDTYEAKNIIESSRDKMTSLKENLSNTSVSIEDLSSKCKQIEEVMGAIKAISEQTNLLALNAAIESARAGEHGRGFAVVASEVRDLAMKTGENAEQINQITNELVANAGKSVTEMKACVEQASETAEASIETATVIDRVTQSIKSVSANIASVATAAEEQSAVSDDISASTHRLSESSADLKEYADQTNGRFVSLKEQIGVMTQELNRFSV